MSQWLEGSLALFQQYGIAGLFILSFVEASFFPIPPYLLSVPMTLANPRLGLVYAAVGVFGSVLGGLLGYAIGLRVGRPVLARLLKPATLDKLESSFGRYGGWAIAAGGVTPVPFKVFAIAAGVFRVRILTFIPASVVARGIRFFGEAALLMLYGRAVTKFLHESLGPVNLIATAVLVLLAVVMHKTGFWRKAVSPRLRRITASWKEWAARARGTVEPVGHFGWYLLTGATLMAFGFLFFAKVVEELLERDLVRFDRIVGHWVTALRTDWLTPIMAGITNLGATDIIIGLTLLLTVTALILHRRWLDILTLHLCAVGAWKLSEFLKGLFHRERPPLPWLEQAGGYSFPSGHALVSLSFYGFLAYFVFRHTHRSPRRNLIVAGLALIPFAVGLSRVYLGVHYPSDVLGGWAVAAGWLGTCVAAREALRNEGKAR